MLVLAYQWCNCLWATHAPVRVTLILSLVHQDRWNHVFSLPIDFLSGVNRYLFTSPQKRSTHIITTTTTATTPATTEAVRGLGRYGWNSIHWKEWGWDGTEVFQEWRAMWPLEKKTWREVMEIPLLFIQLLNNTHVGGDQRVRKSHLERVGDRGTIGNCNWPAN